MAKGGIAAAIAGGLNGYLRGMMYNDDQARQQARDQIALEEHGVRMDEANRVKGDRIALADAARPAAVQPNITNDDDGNPSSAPPLRVVGPGAVQNFDDPGQASLAATRLNDPAARNERISMALDQTGDPTASLRYGEVATRTKAAAMDLADKQWRRQLGDAVKNGHDGIADMVTNSQGDGLKGYRLKAVPSADGKNVTYAKVADDGTVTDLPNLKFSNDEEGAIRAAYMLDRTVSPEQRYSHMLTEERNSAATNAKLQDLELKKRQLEEVAIPNMETKAALAEIRGQIAQARAAGGTDKVGREERLRYTTLFSDAGRRMAETQKTMNSLQRDQMFAINAKKPGTPEAQQLQSLNEELASHKQERDLYQGLLAGSGTGKQPGLADAEKPGSASKIVEPKSQSEYDALPKGARYVRNGQTYIKK